MLSSSLDSNALSVRIQQRYVRFLRYICSVLVPLRFAFPARLNHTLYCSTLTIGTETWSKLLCPVVFPPCCSSFKSVAYDSVPSTCSSRASGVIGDPASLWLSDCHSALNPWLDPLFVVWTIRASTYHASLAGPLEGILQFRAEVTPSAGRS